MYSFHVSLFLFFQGRSLPSPSLSHRPPRRKHGIGELKKSGFKSLNSNWTELCAHGRHTIKSRFWTSHFVPPLTTWIYFCKANSADVWLFSSLLILWSGGQCKKTVGKGIAVKNGCWWWRLMSFFFSLRFTSHQKLQRKQDSSTKKMLKTSPKAKFSVRYYFVEPFLKTCFQYWKAMKKRWCLRLLRRIANVLTISMFTGYSTVQHLTTFVKIPILLRHFRCNFVSNNNLNSVLQWRWSTLQEILKRSPIETSMNSSQSLGLCVHDGQFTCADFAHRWCSQAYGFFLVMSYRCTICTGKNTLISASSSLISDWTPSKFQDIFPLALDKATIIESFFEIKKSKSQWSWKEEWNGEQGRTLGWARDHFDNRVSKLGWNLVSKLRSKQGTWNWE